ncbi:MAG: hypothetical protein K0S12_924 [Bacteroidetes bacterium]|jgi:hypothetical protein|nr:hypothetical protein [Bacteroidota bacterium]
MKNGILLFIFFALCEVSIGQNDSSGFTPKYRKGIKYIVITTQNKVSGFLVRETAETVVIEDRRTDQLHEIRKNSIVSMRPASDKQVYREELLDENTHAHTYLFGGSSFVSGSADSYVNYQWFLLQNINYGINEYIDITVNTIFLYPTSIGVKGKYDIGEKTYVGANAFFVGNFNSRVNSAFFIGYGALGRITHGTSNNNFSFSAGVLGLNSAFWQLSVSTEVLNLPFGNFSYCNRFHEKWAVCAEAWYFPQAEIGFAGIGFKFLRSKQSSWTFGCYTNVNTVNNQLIPNLKTVPIPYLGVTSNLFTR